MIEFLLYWSPGTFASPQYDSECLVYQNVTAPKLTTSHLKCACSIPLETSSVSIDAMQIHKQLTIVHDFRLPFRIDTHCMFGAAKLIRNLIFCIDTWKHQLLSSCHRQFGSILLATVLVGSMMMIQLMHINGILILIPKCHVTDETIRMHASISSHIGRLSSHRLLYYRLSDSVNSRREFIFKHDNQNHYLLFAVASSHEFNVIGSNTLSRLLYLIVLEL